MSLAHRVDLWPILGRLGGPSAAAHASPGAWCRAGLPERHLSLLTAEPGREGSISGSGISGIDVTHPAWPPLLRDLPGGPVALTAEGDLRLLSRTGVAIVGSRQATPYGERWAAEVARAVVLHGGVVVSGLAQGIDAAAHSAAGGQTIAVLGQGLSAPMSAWQRRLRSRILDQGGLVLAEFPPGQSAGVWTFPIRNRIIAGLSGVVAVMEAGEKSGARITARHALTYGREVLALPGSTEAAASSGCLDLLEEGATMIRSVETVLRVSGLLWRGPSPPGTSGRLAEEVLSTPLLAGPQEDACRRVLSLIGRDGATPEGLSTRLSWTLPAVMEILGELELLGCVARSAGCRYVPARS